MSKKPCAGCPDAENYKNATSTPLPRPQVYYVPPRRSGSALQDLQLTLPPSDGVRREFQRPVFFADGGLEYPRLADDSASPPDDIEGYKRDPQNPWRFHPTWQDCILRGQGTKLKPNGCIDVAMACNNPHAELFGRPVLAQDCADCPVRKNAPLPK